MTNALKVSVVSVSLTLVLAAVLSFGAFAVIAHADGEFDLGSYGGEYDLGSYGNFGEYDLGSYGNTGEYDLGSYGNVGEYDLGSYGNTGEYDLGSYGNVGEYDLGSYGNVGEYDLGSYDAQCGCDYQYDEGVGYSNRDYGSSGSGYGSMGYGSSGFGGSMPFSFRAPSTSYAPSYPISYPAPQPIHYPVQQQQQQQAAQPINIVNTNNNNNVNTNVNTVSVIPVTQTPVTYPVQYVYPQQPVYPTYPTYPTQNTYCTITASPSSISNGQAAYLTWSSSGATSAWLSDGIGQVAVQGSLAVRPNSSKTYTLTVSGYNGTNTCSTYVTVNGSYISLSQIPYTGFDFGILGNTIYWLSLLSFAVAAGYLVVYYKGGMLTLAGAMLGSRKVVMQEAPVETKVEVVETPVETMTPSPIQIDAMENLPVAPTAYKTMDSMTVMHSKEGGAPSIVITRS